MLLLSVAPGEMKTCVYTKTCSQMFVVVSFVTCSQMFVVVSFVTCSQMFVVVSFVTCTQMFVVVSFTKSKQCKGPSADGWISKMWYRHTMKYYSAVNSNKLLTPATTFLRLNPQTLYWFKETRHKRPRYVWFHLREMSRKGKSVKRESRFAGSCLGRGVWVWINLRGHEGPLAGDGDAGKVDSGAGCMALYIC